MIVSNNNKVIFHTLFLLLFFGLSASSQPVVLSDIIRPQWKDGVWFIIDEWRRNELMAKTDPPWMYRGRFRLTIKKGNNEVKNCKWIIQMEKSNGQKIGTDIYSINIYYDKELNIIAATGYTAKKKPITFMSTHDWRDYTDYNFTMHFFQVPKTTRSIIMEKYDSEAFKIMGGSEAFRIELEKEQNYPLDYQVWKKDMSWWIYHKVDDIVKYWLIYSSEEEK